MGVKKKKQKATYAIVEISTASDKEVGQYYLGKKSFRSLQSTARKTLAMGIVCFVLSVGLMVLAGYYMGSMLKEKNNEIEALTAQVEALNTEKNEIQVSLDEKIMAEQEKEAIDALMYVPSNYPVTGASSVTESEEVVALNATSTSIRPVAIFTGDAGATVVAAGSGMVLNDPDVADEVNEAVLDEYRMLCKQNNKIKAIGEIGLDYHYEDIPRDIQKKAFRMQMELARELNLPVIVHERDAHEDGMKIVEEFPDITGVFHCYSGSYELAKWLIDRGWYIGFTGVLTFKNARKAVDVASRIPLDRLVLETDCPYMSPEPFRGKRNDPGKLYRMAERLAEIRGMSLEEIHDITLENGKRLYRI